MELRRGCTPAFLDALRGHFHPTALFEVEWHDGTYHYHSGQGSLSWGGHTWFGLGYAVGSAGVNLVDFTAPAEGDGMTADGGSVRMAATLEMVFSQRGKLIRNRPLTAWLGAVTEPAGQVLLADPVQVFTGYFDTRDYAFARGETDFTHDLLLGLGIGPAPRASAVIRHSAEDQMRSAPGDTAGRHLILAMRREANPPMWPEA